MDFYSSPSKGTEDSPCLKQGDILWPIAFFRSSISESQILIEGALSPQKKDITTIRSISSQAKILANLEMSIGIVLNQSCDLTGKPGREKPILIARVLPCNERIRNFRTDSIERRVQSIKALINPGRCPSLFYLPKYTNNEFSMVESVVDLLEVQCFPSMDLHTLTASCLRVRLSDEALRAFQERLAYCFGRFGAPDHLYYTEEEWNLAKNP